MAFDGYGTLFDWDFRASMRAAIEAQGFADADFEALAKSFEQAWNRVNPWAEHVDEDGSPDHAHMLGGPTPEWISTWEMWRRQFEHTFAVNGLDGNAVQGADRFRETLSHAAAYPDAHDTVDALDAAGYRLGLLSNADEDFLQSAVSHNRLRFSVIQTSESLRVYKPNRAAFDELCHRLGCAPHEVLYVGDSPQADVAGARHAGLRVAWINQRPGGYELPEHYPRPDFTVDSLTAAAAVLDVAVPARATS